MGLAEKAPRGRLATATVATSVAMLQTRYCVGCRQCRRCRQINHHSIWRAIFGYRRRSVSAHRIGTTLQFLVSLMARCCFLDVLTPPSHHRTPTFNVVSSVVSASDFVPVDMRQRDFDPLWIPPMLVQDGAGHGAHAAVDQPALETHAFQGYIGGLAIAALAIYEWNSCQSNVDSSSLKVVSLCVSLNTAVNGAPPGTKSWRDFRQKGSTHNRRPFILGNSNTDSGRSNAAVLG